MKIKNMDNEVVISCVKNGVIVHVRDRGGIPSPGDNRYVFNDLGEFMDFIEGALVDKGTSSPMACRD